MWPTVMLGRGDGYSGRPAVPNHPARVCRQSAYQLRGQRLTFGTVNRRSQTSVDRLGECDRLGIVGVLNDDTSGTETLDLKDCTIGQNCRTAGVEQHRVMLKARVIPCPWLPGDHINTGDTSKLRRATNKQILHTRVQEHGGRSISYLGSNAFDQIGAGWDEQHARIRTELTAAEQK